MVWGVGWAVVTPLSQTKVNETEFDAGNLEKNPRALTSVSCVVPSAQGQQINFRVIRAYQCESGVYLYNVHISACIEKTAI
jgi:hypothetical protein